MKYLEPEMEIVEWDAKVITDSITVASNEESIGNTVPNLGTM